MKHQNVIIAQAGEMAACSHEACQAAARRHALATRCALRRLAQSGPSSKGARHDHFQASSRPDSGPPVREDAQDLQNGLRPRGQILFAARAGEDLAEHHTVAGLDPHRARGRAAQLRRQEGHRRTRRAARELAALKRTVLRIL